MLVWLFTVVHAGPSVAFEPVAVDEIIWARPFELGAAAHYAHAAPDRNATNGWLLELRVDPRLMQARQVGLPVLWIGADLAVRTHWNDPGGCAVVWVPGTHDLRHERLFFGSDTLPERMTAQLAVIEQQRAVEAGVKPLPASSIHDVTKDLLILPHEAALLDLAAERSARCAR